MDYLNRWKVLEEMITDLRRNRMVVPTEAMADLRSARTLMSVLEVDPARLDIGQEIEDCLAKVESCAMSEGQRIFGEPYIEKWSKRLYHMGENNTDKMEERATSLHAVPRGMKWVRIDSTKLSVDEPMRMANLMNLRYLCQSDGSLTVYGEDDQLREFIRTVGSKTEAKRLAGRS